MTSFNSLYHAFDLVKYGDFVALVGLHFTTREIRDWVWGTLWWQPGQSQADQPEWQSLSYWKNYHLDIAVDMMAPFDKLGNPRVIFNPYIEAEFSGGTQSNCMHCHRQAAWPDQPPLKIDLTKRRMFIDENWTEFKNRIRTDFLWALSKFRP